MEIKTIEVKNLSHYERGSEETPCYNATVYINGKKAIEVGNDGHGGMDKQSQYDGFEHGIVKQANEWCINKFGKKSFTYHSDEEEKECFYDIDLEQFCHDELYKWLDTKHLKKDLKKQYLFVEDGHLMGYKRKGTDEEFKQFFDETHPKQKCLNFLPFDDALKMFKECA